MQHTDKYKFSIIDPSDAFSPDALNENTKKLETALLEHKSETDTTLSQYKSETDAALAQHKSDTAAALSTHESAMNTRVTAVETAVDAGARFVMLGSGTASAYGQTINFDMSTVNMNDYAALLLFSGANGATGGIIGINLSVNGSYIITLLNNSAATQTASGLTVLQPVGSYVSALTFYGLSTGEGQVNSDTCTTRCARISKKWTNITSLSVSCAYISAATVSLYGVKK